MQFGGAAAVGGGAVGRGAVGGGAVGGAVGGTVALVVVGAGCVVVGAGVLVVVTGSAVALVSCVVVDAADVVLAVEPHATSTIAAKPNIANRSARRCRASFPTLSPTYFARFPRD